MSTLIAVRHEGDIPAALRGTPVAALLRFHNLAAPFTAVDAPELLIGMCMDNRKVLRIPERFAFVIRTPGGNLRSAEFGVSYALAVGGVRSIVLVGHDDCAMVGLAQKRDRFVSGLAETGWTTERAGRHFDAFAPLFEIGDELDFVTVEATRLRLRYPQVAVTPMLYRVSDGLLYLVGDAGD